MVYDGEFVNDVICGEGEMKYSSTCKYQGSWINGLVSGSMHVSVGSNYTHNSNNVRFCCYGIGTSVVF